MTVLWCGGEVEEFIPAPVSSTSVNRRTAYSRYSLVVGTGGFYYCKTPFAEKTSLWATCIVGFGAAYTTSASNITVLRVANSDGKGIQVSKVLGKARLQTWDGTTATTLIEEEVADVFVRGSGYVKVDLQVINYGASGTVNLYIDGILALTYTGDISISEVTGFTKVGSLPVTNATYGAFSEYIVADTDTRLYCLKSLALDAAGDLNEWTGTHGNISASNSADTTLVYTDTKDKSVQFNMTGMPTGDFIVHGVKIVARATTGVVGLGMQMGLKTNSTVDLGSDIALGATFANYEQMYTENPVTSNRFTPTEIDALQIAFKSVEIT
jgi:hypothetical protein